VNFTVPAYILRLMFYLVKLQKLQKQNWSSFFFL